MAARGKVIVAKIPVRGKHPEIPAGYEKINVTSRCKKWGQLSPTRLGPFNVITPLPKSGIPELGFKHHGEGMQIGAVSCLENYWQAQKAFSPVDIPAGVELVSPDQLGPSFFERRAKYFADPQWRRHVYVKKDKQTCVGAYHNGKIYSYVPSRKFYIYYYCYLVKLQPEYAELEQKLAAGKNVFIVDFDGPRGDPIELPKDLKRYKDLIFDPSSPFGHGLVLGGLLAGLDPLSFMQSS